MDPTALYYTLNTIAQCAAALAALIGFLGLWRLDRLREEQTQAEHYLRWMMYREHLNMDPQNAHEVMILPPDRLLAEATAHLAANAREESDARLRELLEKFRRTIDIEALQHWRALPDKQRQLMRVLRIFLMGTLLILAAAIIGFVHVDRLTTWAWTTRLLYVASVWLVGAPVYVVLQAARSTRALLILALLLALASPALAGPVRCQTYPEPSMGRLQTLCDDGTRATSTWSSTLGRWDTTVTLPPGQTCQGRLNPKTHQWEGRCR